MNSTISILLLAFLLTFVHCKYKIDKGTQYVLNPVVECSNKLSSDVRNQLATYKTTAQLIVHTLQSDPNWANKTWNDMAEFTDSIGPRHSGTGGELEAVEYFMKKFGDIKLDKVHKEKVRVQKILKGREKLEMLTPRPYSMSIVADGHTTGTSFKGITARAIVVRSVEELQAQEKNVSGKIVIFNLAMNKAGGFYSYWKIRNQIVADSNKYGALAVLSASATPFSLYTPHQNIGPPGGIPVGSLTVEDAQLLDRLSNDEGQVINLHLKMIVLFSSVNSYNVLADYVGSTKPSEIVAISGHLDNVEIGLGAQDDAIGLFLTTNTLALLKFLDLRPRRTLRAHLFASKELSFASTQFVQRHLELLKSGAYKAALEADSGCVVSDGWKTLAEPIEFQCFLYELMSVLLPEKNYEIVVTEDLYTDVGLFQSSAGIPAADLNGDRTNQYRWYYHSAADMMNTLDPGQTDQCLALYAITAYVLADFEQLPFSGVKTAE